MATQYEASEPLLRTDDLTRRFGRITAVDGVNLSLAAEDFTAIIGPNGAGKTTLLRLLTGELQPTSGRVWFAGTEVTGMSQQAICRLGLGKSYQRSSLFEDLGVVENVRLAVQQSRNDRLSTFQSAERFESDLDRAHEILEDLGLEAEADKRAGSLSHGEKRKLDIAITVASDVDMILLDEPMSGVSEASTDEIVELLNYLSQDYTVVAVEHNISFVMDNADRILVLENGSVIADGSPAEIQKNQRVQDAYLGN